ncbi:MAG: ABC transporter ATP-binding protein [Planctomycetes bacterium]|nr:ABC transporter ATP-binding protein [Planctomycetota bacterium]
MPRLRIEGLCVQRDRRLVVDGASLALDAGEVVALVGPNGAGKSTLLKAALALVPAQAGRVLLDGADLLAMPARLRARRVAYVPQRSRLSAPMSVENVVGTGRFAQGGPLARRSAADQAAIAAALAAADAGHLAARPFNALSGGEQQRVLIARALATGAGTLLLDEPTAGLDIAHALALVALLRRLAGEGRAVLAVLHDLDEVRRAADRAVLLVAGRVRAEGPPAALFAGDALAEAFGVEAVPGAACGFRLVGGR